MKQNTHTKTKSRMSWRTILTYVTIVALVLFVYALREQIADVFANLGTVKVIFLPLMLVTQAVNYHAYSKFYQSMFSLLGVSTRYKDMLRVQLELNFVNTIFPSGGVSGVSYFSVRTRSFGIAGSKAALVQVMKFALVFVSFQILLLAGLFILAIESKVNNLTILVVSSLVTLLAVGTILGVYIISQKSRITAFLIFFTKAINYVIYFFRRSNKESINLQKAEQSFYDLHENYLLLHSNYRQLKKPLMFALLANITEVLTIYVVYLAFGQYVNIGAVIIAYAVANFAGLISVLPGGVGIYEALMTTVLATAGVRPEVSIPVTVMYRVLNMLIQLPPGYFFYHRAIMHSGVEKAEAKDA